MYHQPALSRRSKKRKAIFCSFVRARARPPQGLAAADETKRENLLSPAALFWVLALTDIASMIFFFATAHNGPEYVRQRAAFIAPSVTVRKEMK